jgi:hypothetical protein
MEKINLTAQKFNKSSFNKRVNTSFTELIKSDNTNIFNNLTSDTNKNLSNFFSMYNELFYDIPKDGQTQSHEFLIKESAAYIDFNQNEELIASLQSEISSLRKELLEEQQRTAEILNSLNNNDNG